MNTSHAASFFQSQDAQDKAARQAAKAGNTLGKPLKLPTKILSITTDPAEARFLYVTESGSVGKRIDMDTEAVQVYRGHTAPVTCGIIAGNFFITGSWDKTIRVYNKQTATCQHVLQGHSDFLKCLLYLPDKDLLVSGSADRSMRVWCLRDFTYLYTLKSHPRAVEQLCLLPSGHIISGGSEGSIRTWSIDREGGKEVGEVFWAHDTGINKLIYNEEEEVLLTASNDGFARRFVNAPGKESWQLDTKCGHPDFVRDVVLHGSLMITACRDEAIRVFDSTSGDLMHTLHGHFSDITGLALLGDALFSISIDCTLRRWTLTQAGLIAHEAEWAAWETADPEPAQATDDLMSAEERAELEALMDSDDDA